MGGLLGVGWAKSFTVKRYEVDIFIFFQTAIYI